VSVTVNIPKTVSGEPLRGEAQAQAWRRAVSGAAGQPSLKVKITAADEGAPSANDRLITLQVCNRLLEPCFGVFPLLVVIGTDEVGGPGGTQTTSWEVGAEVAELAAAQSWIVLTDPNGSAVLKATVAGAGTRYVKAGWDGAMAISGPIEWVP